jgi:hypothetical protein
MWGNVLRGVEMRRKIKTRGIKTKKRNGVYNE